MNRQNTTNRLTKEIEGLKVQLAHHIGLHSKENHRTHPIITMLGTVLLAVGTSFVTIYFAYFRESERLEAILLSFDPTGDTLIASLGIYNKGNRQAIVQHMDTRYFFKGNPWQGVGIPIRRSDVAWPRIINPGEILVARLSIPMGFSSEYTLFEKISGDPDTAHDPRHVYVGLSWVVSNSNGVQFTNQVAIGRLLLKKGRAEADPVEMNGYSHLRDTTINLFTKLQLPQQ